MNQEAANPGIPGVLAKLPHVEAVVFDAVGTVMYPNPSVAEAYQRAIRRHCGRNLDLDQVALAVREALGRRSRDTNLQTSEDNEKEFWWQLIRTLCSTEDHVDDGHKAEFRNCFDELFDHFQRPGNWACFPDVKGLIVELKRRGLKTALASNFDRRLNSVCDGLHDLQRVDYRIISSVIGWRKPAELFFDAVTEQLGVPANRILFVGDDLTNDIEGALNAGMQAAWIRRGGEAMPVADGAIELTSLQQLIADSSTDIADGAIPGSLAVS